jgi:hypothetical protein
MALVDVRMEGPIERVTIWAGDLPIQWTREYPDRYLQGPGWGYLQTPLSTTATTMISSGLCGMPQTTSATPRPVRLLIGNDPKTAELVTVVEHFEGSVSALITRGAEGTVVRTHPLGERWEMVP